MSTDAVRRGDRFARSDVTQWAAVDITDGWVIMAPKWAVTLFLLLTCTSVLTPMRPGAAEFVSRAMGYTLAYPDGWYVHEHSDTVIALTTFREFLRGGVIPPGGAAINIQVLPLSSTSDTAVDRLYLTGVRWTVTIAGKPAVREDGVTKPAGVAQHRTAIGIRTAGKQFLFILDYGSEDKNRRRWEDTLLNVISSVSVALRE